MSREVVVVNGARTAIGTYGGSLKDIAPSDLAARVVKEAVARAKVDPKMVGHLVLGHVVHTEPKDQYISRLAAVGGGAESMSRGGYMIPAARWGARMGDSKMMDMMVGALTDPFDTVHMGV